MGCEAGWDEKHLMRWADKTKKVKDNPCLLLVLMMAEIHPYFPGMESETVSLFLPLALRRASTFLPFRVCILFLNPCLFFLFLFDG